jgi:hypothetical protein
MQATYVVASSRRWKQGAGDGKLLTLPLQLHQSSQCTAVDQICAVQL